MKLVTILGTGMVSSNVISYLANKYNVIVVDKDKKNITSTLEKIDDNLLKKITSYYGNIFEGNLKRNSKENSKESNTISINSILKKTDLTVSLLPPQFHPKVAQLCYDEKSHLITTSYVSDEMRNFDFKARHKNLIFLNELGLDPGIDHMSAMKLLDDIRDKGGLITGFESDCGGLPSEPNVNPLHYLSSWRMTGPLVAIKGTARFFKNNKIIEVPEGELFKHVTNWYFRNIGNVEVYPNRDVLPYFKDYKLNPKILKTFMRGTIRYKGWTMLMKSFFDVGLLSYEKPKESTFLDYMKKSTNINSLDKIFKKFNIDRDSIDSFNWLNFYNTKLDNTKTILDNLADIMSSKMKYDKNTPVDSVIMKHFVYYSNGKDNNNGKNKQMKKISTMIYNGVSHKDTAMSTTVGLPAAMGGELILEGKLNGITGVHIPVLKEIYNPILDKLEENQIYFSEEIKKIN